MSRQCASATWWWGEAVSPAAIAPRKGKEEDKSRASQKPLVLWNGTEAEALEDHLSASHHFTDEETESERGRGPGGGPESHVTQHSRRTKRPASGSLSRKGKS